MTRTNQIQKISVTSRIIFITLSCLVNYILPDHDSDGFLSPILVTDNDGFFDQIIDFLFGGLNRWDGQHFYHIARYGYTYETNLAFFPLFPSSVNFGANLLSWMTGLNFKSTFIIIVVILNTVLFTKSAVTLYNLTYFIFNNDKIAFNATLFYCISPASIFFVAPYSESMFVFCTFNGMLAYAKKDIKSACAWFCISSSVRSNGLINSGFIAHYFFSKIINLSKKYKVFNIKFVQEYTKYLFYLVLSLSFIIAPFIIFQIDGFYRFCKSSFSYPVEIVKHGERNSLLMPGDHPIWCDHRFPMPYSYVQKTYWDVGFLRYYSLKQIPNFCLAFPVVVIILGSCLQFLYKYKNLFIQADEVYVENKTSSINLPKHSFVFIVHAVFLTIFCVFNINVQVTTRMLASSSPVLYWIASTKFLVKNTSVPPDTDYIRRNCFKWNEFHRSSYNIISYFVSYAIVGTILFSNNLPWT